MKKSTSKLLIAALASSAIIAPISSVASAATPVKEGVYFSATNEFFTVEQLGDLSTQKIGKLFDENSTDQVFIYTEGIGTATLAQANASDFISAANENGFKNEPEKIIPEGSYVGKDGNDIVIGDVVAPELSVESVSAITFTGVEVTFPEVTEAIEDANVVVKDGEGNVVPTEAKLLAEGETSAEFAFTTPFKADHKFTGVWTVNGKEYSFDAINQLADIVDAVTKGNQIELQAALDAAGITYADETRIVEYLAALQEDGATASLEAVQKAITKVDEDTATEADKEAAVKAVADAKTQAQLLKALQDNFDLVNPTWIVNYANPEVEGEGGEPTAETAGNADLLAFEASSEPADVAGDFDVIQEAVYNTNVAKVAPKVADANLSLDSKKVAEARTLVTNWIPEFAADEDSDFAGLKEYSLDLLSLEDALIAVDQAKTNSALKTALVNLDKLETELVEKYSEAGLVSEFDIDTVEDANLTAYRNAIAKAEVGAKNQRKDIQKIVTDANNTAVDTAKEKVLENLNKVSTKTAATDVVSLLAQYKALDKETVTAEVKPAYSEAYKAEVLATYTAADPVVEIDAAAVQTLVNKVNLAKDADARLAAVNSASTASEMSTALIALEAADGATAFTNLSSTAKLEVAEIVLAKRNAEDDKKFANKDVALASITTPETGAIAVRTAFLNDVNDESTIAGVQVALAGEDSLLPDFAKLDAAAQVEKAEAVLNALTALKADGKAGFSTVTEIKTIVE
ncbi:hypothetical protein [Sporosarcina sp. P33]|uniref:hypothetical protein n=1 Tax=Sporosarcina sp. P33 TaxID=1930764 RepID=UPI0009BE957F|nr:hypothetical protein [Sporosarcina sp. P33]ARD48830.1 hypothetical protein SporoP33_11750 [Sporosarcina sp. P33]